MPQKRNVLHSPRLAELKKRRKKVILWKIILFFFCLILFIGISAYFSRLNGLNISEVQVAGNKVVDSGAIQSVAEENLSGKYLWLFPKTNILFYPEHGIENQLQNTFGRLKSVHVSIEKNKILVISVDERTPAYIWCGALNAPMLQESQPGSASSGTCYFVDESGYIFDVAPYFSGEVYFKLYGPTQPAVAAGVNPDSPIGTYFYKDNFADLMSFKDVLVSMGLKPVAVSVSEDGDVEFFLAHGVPPATEPKVLFKLNADFQNIAENLQTALATEPLKSGFKNKYSSLLYIDLRFGNKVYDKFQ